MAQEILRPDEDGYYNDWTPLGGGSRYVEVDEVTPDEDTSYIYVTSGTYKSQNFKLTPFTGSGVINSITIRARIKHIGASNPYWRFILYTVGLWTSGFYVPTTSYGNESWYLETDPNDSNPWTTAKLEDGWFGVDGCDLGNGGTLRCTWMEVVVDYTEPAGHSFGAIIG